MKIIVNKRVIDISRKGFTVSLQPGQERSPLSDLLPRTLYDYAAEVGDGRQSAIIMACVSWAQRTFPEAPIMLEKQTAGEEWERQDEHPLLTLLDSPNPYYDGLLMQSAMIADWMLDGNAYEIKVRSGAGRVVQLWWTPSGLIEPKWPYDNKTFLSHYEYNPGGGTGTVKLKPEDVVHFRNGIDPRNLRKGLSPLKALFREVFTDDEAANMTSSLLKNLGVPGVVISPDVGASVSTEEAELTKAWFKEKFTGDYRGDPLIMSGATKVQPFTFSPQQMDLKALRRIPEERVSGVLGIPAIVAGLGAGLDRSTFANFKEAREAAYESMIIPTQRLIASTIKRQLLRDYEDDLKIWNVGYDLSQVRILQEDENALSNRTVAQVQGGILKIADAQRLLNIPVDETQDIYLRTFNMIPVASGDKLTDGELIEGDQSLGKSLALKALDDKTKEFYWKQYVLKAENYERQFKGSLHDIFRSQEKEALVNLKEGKTGDLINIPNAKRQYREKMTPILSDLAEKASMDAGALISGPVPGKALKQASFRVLSWLKSRIPWAGAVISEETAKLLSEQLAEGYSQGESIDDISRRVKKLFDGMETYRAERIARTEIIATSNQSSLSTYEEYGVHKKEWLAALDERTRESHLQANGQVVGIDEDFKVGNDMMPAPGQGSDPAEVINCRCTILPVVDL